MASHLGNHDHEEIVRLDVAALNLVVVLQHFARVDQFHAGRGELGLVRFLDTR